MAIERYTDVRPEDVEDIVDTLRRYAGEYGGRIKHINKSGHRFEGAEAILPASVGDEYIPSTKYERQNTLPHISNMHQFSGLLRSRDGLSRFTLKESYAADLLDSEPRDDDEEPEIPRQTLNIHAFYRFVWGPEGVIQAMVRGSHSVDTRPLGYQKYIVRTADAETGDVVATTLRRLDVAENTTGEIGPFLMIERDPDLLDLQSSMAQYAAALVAEDANERALLNSADIDAMFRDMLARTRQ